VRERLFVALVAAVMLGSILGPAVPSLGRHFLGIEYVDHYGTQWFYWFAGEVATGRTDPLTTDLLFHPWGKDILHHTGVNVLDALLAVPWLHALGPVLGYNAFVLVGMLASAWAFHSVARRFSRDTVALGVGTLLFATSPFLLFELLEGRPTQAILVLPVLFLGQVLRVGEQPGLKAPLVGGLLLALTGYQYWFYALFCGIACLGYGLWRAWRPLPGAGGRVPTLGRYALTGLVSLVLVAPVASILVGAASSEDVPGMLDVSTWGWEGTAPTTLEELNIGLFLWQPFRRYAGSYIVQDPGLELLLSQGVLLPMVALPLLAIWAWRPGAVVDRGGVLALAIPALVIALGPILVVDHTVITNPFYVLLAKSTAVVQRLWWPARAVVVPVVLVALAATVLLGALARRRALQMAVAVALSAAWMVDLRAGGVLPFPSWDATVPAGYRCLASGPPGAIIELPFSFTQGHLYYQTAHGRPMMGGMLENNPVFAPDAFNDLRTENTFVAEIYDISRMLENAVTVAPADVEAVYALGYRYVVVQKDAYFMEVSGRGRLDNLLRSKRRRMHAALTDVLGRPVYSDGRIDIYAPWGDPNPCVDEPVEPDLRSVGVTEVPADERVLKNATDQLLARPWQDFTELEALLESKRPKR